MRISALENMKECIFLCLLFLGGIFFINQCLGNEDRRCVNVPLQERLRDVSDNERLILDHFFQVLIKSDGLGYTLFGSKPVCLSAYFSTVPMGNMLRGCNSNTIRRGWQIWKKYEKHFPHPNYIIFAEKEIVDDIEITLIYFINKEKLLETLNSHNQLFAQELNKKEFDPEELLSEIEQKQTFFELLSQHEGLLGILLGYGVESSMRYHKRNLVWRFGVPISYVEEGLESVSANCCTGFPFDSGIQPIQFVGNPQSQDVQAILEQNAKERSHLISIYLQGRWLEITLSQLVE